MEVLAFLGLLFTLYYLLLFAGGILVACILIPLYILGYLLVAIGYLLIVVFALLGVSTGVAMGLVGAGLGITKFSVEGAVGAFSERKQLIILLKKVGEVLLVIMGISIFLVVILLVVGTVGATFVGFFTSNGSVVFYVGFLGSWVLLSIGFYYLVKRSNRRFAH